MRQAHKRRVRSLRCRLRREGSPKEQRARIKVHLRLGSCYVLINDASNALHQEDYAAARTATEQVMHRSVDALETLNALDGGKSESVRPRNSPST